MFSAKFRTCMSSVMRCRRVVMESSFAKWNVLQAATPCSRKEAFRGKMFNSNSDEDDRISRHDCSTTITALAV